MPEALGQHTHPQPCCGPGQLVGERGPVAPIALSGIQAIRSGDHVENQRRAREYKAFLAEKVSAARESLQAGDGIDNADVDAKYAARRASAA